MFGGHRLPGVAFETLVPPAPEALPRMDVALFVGFAEMGPVHRAMAIDDVAAYRRIFGGDLGLARDPGSGEIVKAALAPSVRAFFSNGGARCWVIRVARTVALEARWQGKTEAEVEDAPGLAAAGRFSLPGLLARAPGGSLDLALHLATAQARSLGSWSDRLTVAARAERVPFAMADLTQIDSQISFTTDRPLAAGALVELTDTVGSVYARVDQVVERTVSAHWLATFTPKADLAPPEAVTVHALDGNEPHAASYDSKAARLVFAQRPTFAAPERWLQVTRIGGNLIFLVDAIAGDAVVGRAWLPGPVRTPLAGARAAEVTLSLRIDDGLGESSTIAGIGLTPEHAGSWWTNLPDDALPRDAAPSSLLLARIEADATAPPLAWLPLGLQGTFSGTVSRSSCPRSWRSPK